MNSETTHRHKLFYLEDNNYSLSQFKRDPGWKRYKEAMAKCDLPNSWLEISRMLDAAKTEEEYFAISKKLPMKPLEAIMLKRKMGKEAFLARGYNLDYANEELGGPDWVDKY